MAIFTLANHVRIEEEWIPRDLNQTADYISRVTDYDDWVIDHGICKRLNYNEAHTLLTGLPTTTMLEYKTLISDFGI